MRVYSTSPPKLARSSARANVTGAACWRSASQSRLRHAGIEPRSITGDASFLGLVAVLQGNEHRFEETQEHEGNERRHQAPQRDVHPGGRLVGELDVEREAQDDKAEDENGEYRRPIAG